MRDLLRSASACSVELLGMTTRGDQILDRALSKVGGKGLFVKELETALEEGRAHLAVHSLKDVPMDLPAGFVLAAVLRARGPARRLRLATATPTLAELPQGAVVGTSSLRRVVQLLALRPDLRIEPLRGNLDTRLRKLDEGGYDAIVLAAAGPEAPGPGRAHPRRCSTPTQMIPAAGQGALGIEVREDATALREQLAQTLTHRPTWLAVHAERAVSRALGGSCSMPLAAHAVWEGEHAAAGRRAGRRRRRRAAAAAHAAAAPRVADEAAARALGEQAAAQLRAAGAGGYLPPLA